MTTACAYLNARDSLLVREPARVPLSEIEIQSRLFAGEFGTSWDTGLAGRIEILHFGDWNREAGPDFKHATLRFSDGATRTGDIEVDMDARDWERHGHSTNPAFSGVLLQLYVRESPSAAFARTSDNRAVAQARLDHPEQTPLPLRHPPGAVGFDEARQMIEEASDFRLRARHAAHARRVALHGADASLFHALATGLGYKNNSLPFLMVSQRVGLRLASGSSGEALLFGLSGFLEPRTFDSGDAATRDYLKPLWDEWWTLRDGLSRLVLPPGSWKFSGIRPSNHPHRRMGALAAIASHFKRLRESLQTGGPCGFAEFFESLTHPFWSTHWNLSAATLGKKTALVGPDRSLDLLINACLPCLSLESARERLASLSGPTPSGRLRRALQWLTDGKFPELLRSARHQQGLIQLHSDFGSLSALEAWGKIRSGSTKP